jgi:HSP20 family protein
MARSNDDEGPARGTEVAPFQSFGALQREFDRAFHDFGRMLDAPFFRSVGAPRMDVSETESELIVECDLPGVKAEEVDISLDGDRLAIRGERSAEREEKGKTFHIAERSFGAFSRSLALPFEPNAEDVDARFEDGVLKISVKKPPAQATTTQKIAIKSR